MKRGSFIMNGIHSDEVKARIQSRPLIEAPMRKVEMKSAYGVDGDIPFDEGAYSNTNLELILLTDGNDLIADRQKLFDLMETQGRYKELIPYFDPDKIYRVMMTDKMQFENQHYYGEKQSASAKYTVKPYKYLVDSPSVTLTGTHGTLFNPTNYVSQPIIKIKGSGSVRLTVNGEDFFITKVVDHITLNSERYVAYRESENGVLTSMNSYIASRKYPVFRPGNNEIDISGTVTEVHIEPRWRSLV